jgi:hypothetical protein
LQIGATMSIRPIRATVLPRLHSAPKHRRKPTTLALSPTTSRTRLW